MAFIFFIVFVPKHLPHHHHSLKGISIQRLLRVPIFVVVKHHVPVPLPDSTIGVRILVIRDAHLVFTNGYKLSQVGLQRVELPGSLKISLSIVLSSSGIWAMWLPLAVSWGWGFGVERERDWCGGVMDLEIEEILHRGCLWIYMNSLFFFLGTNSLFFDWGFRTFLLVVLGIGNRE